MSSNCKLKVSTSGILKLLAENLYSSHKEAIRELVQNALDSKPKNISVKIRDNIIEVIDDGIGMSEEDLNKNLFTLGYSPKAGNKEMRGEFGIGFWSCINIATKGKIITRKDGKTTFAEIDFNIIRNAIKKDEELNGDEITLARDGAQRSESGTTIILEGDFETKELIEYAENIFSLVEEKIIVNGKVVSQNSLEDFIRSEEFYKPVTKYLDLKAPFVKGVLQLSDNPESVWIFKQGLLVKEKETRGITGVLNFDKSLRITTDRKNILEIDLSYIEELIKSNRYDLLKSVAQDPEYVRRFKSIYIDAIMKIGYTPKDLFLGFEVEVLPDKIITIKELFKQNQKIYYTNYRSSENGQKLTQRGDIVVLLPLRYDEREVILDGLQYYLKAKDAEKEVIPDKILDINSLEERERDILLLISNITKEVIVQPAQLNPNILTSYSKENRSLLVNIPAFKPWKNLIYSKEGQILIPAMVINELISKGVPIKEAFGDNLNTAYNRIVQNLKDINSFKLDFSKSEKIMVDFDSTKTYDSDSNIRLQSEVIEVIGKKRLKDFGGKGEISSLRKTLFFKISEEIRNKYNIKPFQEYEGYWLHNQISIYIRDRAIIVGELALPLAKSGNFRGKILEFNGELWLPLAEGIENAKGCTLTFRDSEWITIGN